MEKRRHSWDCSPLKLLVKYFLFCLCFYQSLSCSKYIANKKKKRRRKGLPRFAELSPPLFFFAQKRNAHLLRRKALVRNAVPIHRGRGGKEEGGESQSRYRYAIDAWHRCFSVCGTCFSQTSMQCRRSHCLLKSWPDSIFELIIPPFFSSVFVLLLWEKRKGCFAFFFLCQRGLFLLFVNHADVLFFLLKREE